MHCYTSALRLELAIPLCYLSRWTRSTEAVHNDTKHGLVLTLSDPVLVSNFTLRSTTGFELPHCSPSMLTLGSAQYEGNRVSPECKQEMALAGLGSGLQE